MLAVEVPGAIRAMVKDRQHSRKVIEQFSNRSHFTEEYVLGAREALALASIAIRDAVQAHGICQPTAVIADALKAIRNYSILFGDTKGDES